MRAGGLPGPGENLVERALAACGRRAGVRLTKRIPLGGGLGGGSADAAAVLRWAGCADPDVAVRLGADVPFCLVGGRALVEGVGERVTPLPFEPAGFLLLLPPFGVDTARVYRAWDEDPRDDGPNALTAAALAVEPRLAAWRDALGEWTGSEPVLAGSGSTWFVEGGDGREVGVATSCARGRDGPAGARPHRAGGLGRGLRGRERGGGCYLPARRCQRVAFSIFLCFFLRMRLRRFLISDPMSCGRLAVPGVDCQVGPPRQEAVMGFEIVRLDHVQLAMPLGREAEAEAFYSGLLGLTRLPKPEPHGLAGAAAGSPGSGGPAPRRRGGLPPRPQGPPGPGGPRPACPGGRPAGRRGGGAAQSGPRPGAGAYVDDPFGNRIELIAGD